MGDSGVIWEVDNGGNGEKSVMEAWIQTAMPTVHYTESPTTNLHLANLDDNEEVSVITYHPLLPDYA